MRTLPWRKKEEEVQWIKHEKTQIRIKREEREERLTAMGYLLRVCTSLFGLKISGFFQFLLLKLSRARSITFGWLKGGLPVFVSKIARTIRTSMVTLAHATARLFSSIWSGLKWLISRFDRAMKALEALALSGTKRLFRTLASVTKRSGPGLSRFFTNAKNWGGSAIGSLKSAMSGFAASTQRVTTVVTQSITRTLLNQRQILAYSAVTLAVFGSVIAAVSMGVFSQLPKSNVIAGVGRIIDADLIKVGDVDIRLYGIDAPEPNQRCKRNAAGRAKWGCGRKAVTQLSNLVNNNQVTCTRKGTDNIGRILASCTVDKWDVAAYMVHEGLAWVSPGDPAGYRKFELVAKDAAVGIWRAKNDTPWSYRETRWTEAKASAPEGCPVKGNISGAGRVYYLPWSNKYDRVRIQLKKGERWFCNERDAIQAGWRQTRYP